MKSFWQKRELQGSILPTFMRIKDAQTFPRIGCFYFETLLDKFAVKWVNECEEHWANFYQLGARKAQTSRS